MNAIRKFRTAFVAGALSFVALAAPADAKYPHSGVHCRDVYIGNRAVFGNTLHFYPTTSLSRSYWRTGSCLTTYNLRECDLFAGDTLR